MPSETLARSGRPSSEKKSSVSSTESMRPSNWNEPQRNRTAGGAVGGSLGARSRGVTKKMMSCVSRRRSVVRVFARGSGAVTSNHSWTESFAVPVAATCAAAALLSSRLPPGALTWLVKLTLSVSGLNCTVTSLPPDCGWNDTSSSIRWAFARVTGLGIVAHLALGRRRLLGAGRALDRQRFVRELQLFDRDHAVLRIERGRLQLDRQASGQEEPDALGLAVRGEDQHLGVGPQLGIRQRRLHPVPEIEARGHAALERDLPKSESTG